MKSRGEPIGLQSCGGSRLQPSVFSRYYALPGGQSASVAYHMHVGAAVGCRVLAVFGPSNSHIWFPYRTPWNQVIEKDLPCRSECRDGCESFPCLAEIPPEEVLVKLRTMLQRMARSQLKKC